MDSVLDKGQKRTCRHTATPPLLHVVTKGLCLCEETDTSSA